MRQFLCLFTHCGLSPAGLRALAEVSRNRTDRPDRIGTTGFEVLGEHQPACTSELILRGPCSGVNLMMVIEPLPKISAPPRCQPDPDVASASSQARRLAGCKRLATGWTTASKDARDSGSNRIESRAALICAEYPAMRVSAKSSAH